MQRRRTFASGTKVLPPRNGLRPFTKRSKGASRRQGEMPSRDYEEFIAALNDHGVRYLLIGAHAVAFHARPRATKDLDVLLDPTPEERAQSIGGAVRLLRRGRLRVHVCGFNRPRWIIQLGVAPVRIDLLSTVPGCPTFQAGWRSRVEARFGSVRAHYLGLADLIRAKEAAGRAQDQADVHVLRRAQLTRRSSRRPKGRG
jgi:predicted nucleotidyltransferase